jgi:hypothetical protein
MPGSVASLCAHLAEHDTTRSATLTATSGDVLRPAHPQRLGERLPATYRVRDPGRVERGVDVDREQGVWYVFSTDGLRRAGGAERRDAPEGWPACCEYSMWMSRSYVLIADDDVDLRSLVADMLRHHGYDIEEVGDGAAALAAMRHATPRAVLLDLVMPGSIDGWGVLLEMRSDPALREIPVCVVSGTPFGVPEGTMVLRKPVAFARLREVVEQLSAPAPGSRRPRRATR